MVFNSLEYAMFFVVALLAYWSVRPRGQNFLLLVASYLFYGWWDARFLSLLVISTAVDYVVGLRLGATDDEGRRKALLFTSVGVNLGILAAFKYYDFFAESAAAFLGALGLEANPALLQVLLPVGISFYTFQSLSYSFDVYRRRIEPARDPLAFAVYVAFFPQLVAGPIERAQHLLPQFMTERRPPSSESVVSALALIVLGLFKKVAIADALAPVANQSFSQASEASWITLAVGVLAFGIQIYGDFSGYTDIARGSARLLGVHLIENFRQPYLSRSITEFWRRWHISLSQWLRDYLYVPLGGNRVSGFLTYRNLMITMLLGGLWHGAAWTFVIWGGIHGALLAAHRRFRRPTAPDRLPSTPRELVNVAGTFLAVHAAWIFFRAESLGQAGSVFEGLLTLRPGGVDPNALLTVVAGLLAMFAIDIAHRLGLATRVARRAPATAGLAAGAMTVVVLASTGREFVPFIYFQF